MQTVSDSSFLGQNARVVGTFKDGPYIRRVELHQGGHFYFKDTENNVLHDFQWYDPRTGLPYGGFANVSRSDKVANAGDMNDLRRVLVRDIKCEHSAFSGKVILIVSGYTADTNDARALTIVTDYSIQPEEHYEG